jgi:hypothetical protein
VLAYYRWRRPVRGRCHCRVLAYTCTENRNSIATGNDARVTCEVVDRAIVHFYQQNL